MASITVDDDLPPPYTPYPEDFDGGQTSSYKYPHDPSSSSVITSQPQNIQDPVFHVVPPGAISAPNLQQQQVVYINFNYSTHPSEVTCPACNSMIRTRVERVPGFCAWLSCICILGCCCLWCGCCLIPFFLESCNSYIHTCPRCHALMGRYQGACAS